MSDLLAPGGLAVVLLLPLCLAGAFWLGPKPETWEEVLRYLRGRVIVFAVLAPILALLQYVVARWMLSDEQVDDSRVVARRIALWSVLFWAVVYAVLFIRPHL